MDHREMVAVIQAHIAGKLIQRRYIAGGITREWHDVTWDGERFNFEVAAYRVKPEPPKPREWRVCLRRIEHTTAGFFAPWDGNVSCSECIQVREVLEETSVP